MISVAVHPNRARAVAEFFELFKTAWQPYFEDESCTVLLTDGSASPDASAEVYILFSPERQDGDVSAAEPQTSPSDGFRVQMADSRDLPVYTACRFFQGLEKALLTEASGDVLAYKKTVNGQQIIRVGYDLFDEVTYLLTTGQPVANAGVAALDRHVEFLRRCILDAGLPVFELSPCPPGHPYMVCLTHDVDFVGIRSYGIGRTFQGFVKRAFVDSWKRVRNGSLTWRGLLKNYAAVLSVPLVHLGLVKDFWMQFDGYRRIEDPNRSTFFLIPFKNRSGEQVSQPYPKMRATRYDVEDVRGDVLSMLEDGWEIGLHGIDAWRDSECGRSEKDRIDSVLGRTISGTRMHWLCRNAHTEQVLDEAGFDYDSTCGYNETVGFRAGTSRVFRPLSADHLLEVPMHIQDVALFYSAFLGLDNNAAWKRCEAILDECSRSHGVLTILWHMRSLAPERLWGDFYQKLLNRFRADGAWFGTACEITERFRKFREVQVSQRIAADGERVICLEGNSEFPVTVRVYQPSEFSWKMEPQFTDIAQSEPAEIRTGFYVDAMTRSDVWTTAV
ncbi:polysaccharide deacetylase family protein [Tichowtungia aerotolerans]|uniref:Uncharacterized protein n=1 Tax=Tichowtungia aerotolerans TaxID=2697043 RepID=A0A6P1M8Q9_9BACT|nr:hypothetical protein [Tichowtungia aerotolerans]QHI70277.1 hypothetical protein GT409_12775 [Tichowtungia aerotolerans]